MPDEDLEKKVYILEGIDCANCAAKIEAKIRQMPEVGFASVAFATKQLRVSANNQAELLPKMQAVVDSIEDGVTIVPRQRKKLSGISNTKVYILEGLDCANCAAKIEAKLRTLNGVDDLTITYATKQMKLSAKNPDQMIPMIKETIDAMEDGITIVPKDNKVIKSEEAGEKKFSFNNPLVSIGVGAVIFIIGEILEHVGNVPTIPMFALFLIAYLVLGGKVLITAGKNIMKGQVFDENFLMCIATIGAFCIQEFPEAVGVMLFYRIGEYFEEKATEQSRTQIMEAVDLRPEVVNLIVGEDIRVIDAEEANVGDILLVRPGDRIPLDGVIIDGESRIDTSPVTGEPVPVMAKAGDNIVSGCVNTSGQLKIRVEKILEESMVTRILDSVENAAASKPNIDKFITRFARVYTPFVVLFALFVAVVLPFILPDSLNWHFFVDSAYTGTVNTIHGTSGTASIYTAMTILLISCPCALVLSVPLAFFSGIGAGSKKGILFKGGIAIESLKNVKAIVMDKTGTITKGNFVVQKANPAGNAMTANDLLAISASCELSSTHPIGNSIVEAAEEKGLSIERPSKVEEIAGHGIRAELSRGVVLCGNRKLMDEQNVDLSSYQKEDFGTEVLVALNGKFVGNIVISDTAGTLTMIDTTNDKVTDTKDIGEAFSGNITYDEMTGTIYFVAGTNDLYGIKVSADGKLKDEKKVRLYETGYSSTTPEVYNGKVYVSGSKGKAFQDKGYMAVADVSSDKYKVNYTVELSNYSQCEPTIVKTGENSVRVYFTINDEPGGIYAIEDSKDATSATLETVYEPTGDIKNTGCMSDVVVDEDGTIYFANDSKYIMSVGKKVEDTKKSDVITVKPVTKTVKSTRSVKLTWKKKKGAKGYVIYAKAGKGKYKKVTTVGKTTSKTIKVNKDSSYKFKVKPYKLTKKNKKKYFKAYAAKAKFGSKTVKVTFKNVTGYASYKVQMKAGKAAYKTVKTTIKGGTITYTKKKAKVGTTYKFSLKGINKVNGKTVSVTIK